MEHLLSFSELSELYGMQKLGKLTKNLQNELICFQLVDRAATKESAMEFMLNHKDEFLARFQA